MKLLFATALIAVAARATGPTCLTPSERAIDDLPDFYNIVFGTDLWSDTDFTPDATSLFWDGLDASQTDATVVWARACDEVTDATLFGDNGVSPEGCPSTTEKNEERENLAAVLSTLAKDSGRIEGLFVN